MRITTSSLAVLFITTFAHADVKLPAIISDHAVLQNNVGIPIWGWAEPGEAVAVTLGGKTMDTKADADGKWIVKFDKLTSRTEAIELKVQGKNAIVVKDLLVGEVWLGSGQSNMAMQVSRCKDFEAEKAAAKFPLIRMFKENSPPSDKVMTVGTGKWEICSPETVGGFSATAYFFGREVHKNLNVPVGLINSSVGGTPIEAWTRMDVQKNLTELKPMFEKWEKAAKTYDDKSAQEKYKTLFADWQVAAKAARDAGKVVPRAPTKPVFPHLDSHHPATLYNAKIAPIVPYAIKGFLWYQGENNSNNKDINMHYGLQLRTMIEDWRKLWGQGDLAFAWVQLPNFRKAVTDPVQESGWVTVRDQMAKTLSVPNTGMAVTLDIGEEGDIHPKNKKDVGKRLATWALAKVYDKKEFVGSGPMYAKHEVRGSDVVITFNYAEGGLVSKGDDIKGFAISGADGKWQHAKARIEGTTIIVSHPDVKEPKAVRYAWTENPQATLANKAGLLAAPFRTDAK